MRWPLLLPSLLATAAAGRAAAQEAVVTSPAPDRIALTVYRAPDGEGALDLRSLDGFALVTETRRVRLPRGAAVLRFEGVAEGIVPVSAVIDGLPGGVVEKNRDLRLLSPASLVDGTLSRTVTLTRTDRATGRTVSEQATIVAGPGQGVVLRTAAGVEALRCAGLPERLAYSKVPPGLSAKPVLSVGTISRTARTVTVRLSYLASGFDWRASYVATLGADGHSLDLFAWLTLANANPEVFRDAEVSAVAGRLNRVWTPQERAAIGALSLRCYPLGTTTSELREQTFEPADAVTLQAFGMKALRAPPAPAAPPPPPPPPPPPEDVGDLKLYHVPEPVTVGARGQKQVALLSRTNVPFERRYRRTVNPGETMRPSATSIVLVLRNAAAGGLGLPLPSGGTALYGLRGTDRLLLGLGRTGDHAEGETVRLAAGTSAQVLVEQKAIAPDRAEVSASNANSFPVAIDVPIGAAGQSIKDDGGTLAAIDGVATWSTTLPPGGHATLRYRFER